MEEPPLQTGVEQVQKSPLPELKEKSPPENVKKGLKTTKVNATIERLSRPNVSARSRMEPTSNLNTSTASLKSTSSFKSTSSTKSAATRTVVAGSSKNANSAPVLRRNSTGGLHEKQTSTITKRHVTTTGPSKKTSPLASEPLRRSLPEVQRSPLPLGSGKSLIRSSTLDARKSNPSTPVARTSRTLSNSDGSKLDSGKKSAVKSSPSVSSTRTTSTSLDPLSSSATRKSVSKISLPSTRSPSVSSGSKINSLPSSADRTSALSGRRKVVTPDSRDSRLIMLPQVEVKAGDDVRLDLRGHRIRNLASSGLNLSSSLEFVYLRDNLLSTLEGIEVLKRVKVLDLSFNDFKGPGFEPLENCKALQQLYLAGNQIASLVSLPELPNLEFLSVAQNKLKSLSMASQPRLQVLAASKNKISTLKGFPYLPALEHLRVEENPLLEMRHLEAACILLIGPTLKKFNDRDLSPEEVAYAKRFPAHAPLCIKGGWEFCHPNNAFDSTFRFLLDQWKDQLPPGYVLDGASVDQPFEDDACGCHFNFTKDKADSNNKDLIFKYQWFVGDSTLANFVPILDAIGEVYWPKHEDIDRVLKVECTPILDGFEHPAVFAISSPVSPGTGYPKVLKIDVHGELVEGNIIRGNIVVAWCGGTPGKSIASWLRKRWNSSPVVIVGAEDEEYKLTLDDVDSCLMFMYTPVTEEGSKGEPQYAITDYVKAAPPSVSDVQIVGDAVEGNSMKGVGKYFGGREGPSKFEWLRENKDNGDFVLVSAGTTEYTLTKEDVGRRLAFVYIPINFEGQEGKSVSMVSLVVKPAPPKVTNVKIIGDLREGSKVTVTGTVTRGTEGSSRVQWFKTSSSNLEGETGLEVLSTSKIAKAFRIPLGAVGYFIVAKFTPMTHDGEAGEPGYAISECAVETLPPSLNFLSITGDYCEGEILTASYGYIGGHEGKSIYNWYLHEVETDSGTLIPEVAGLLQYRISKDAIGRYISFTCIPLRNDGMSGESRTCMSQERIRPGSPKLLSLEIVGTAMEGTTLVVDKKYWGGVEGDSVFRWFRTGLDGTEYEVKDATSSSYALSLDDIGFYVFMSCEPVRSDWISGPVVLSEQIGPIIPGPPTCQSLEFTGSSIEGQRLNFISSYSGGEKGDCFFEWFRVNSNGTKEKLINPCEYLDLTLEDVGKFMELVYTPVRNDGVQGSTKSITSGVVAPGEPIGVRLIIPDCCEDMEIVPERTYFGGQEGEGQYIWYRSRTKLQGSSLRDISDDLEDVFLCGKSLNYTPVLEDVGAFLALYWLPTRIDGKHGNPLVSICDTPVMPAFPVVSDVHVKELSSGTFYGEGKYFGGYEGESLFSWYRETYEGNTTLIPGANSRTYAVTDSDYNCRLLFGYKPVRLDSVVGELRLSEPTGIILPELPKIEMLALTGKAIEGDVLTAVEVIPESEIQRHVWGKYKKDTKYQWFCTSEPSNMTFEPLPSHRSCSYKVRFEDIGHHLRCECIVTDVFGRSTQPAYAETSSILPGFPRVDKLEIEGRGYHTNLYAIRGVYSGGKEGKSSIQWLRSMVGSPDLISISGETGKMYEANVDDVGYRLVVVYTPVREDGVEGQPVSASTEPIAVEPDILKEVKLKLDLGAVKFEVLCDKERSLKKAPGSATLERRSLEVNRKRIKVVKPGSKTSFPTTEIRGSYAPPFHVELFRNDQHRLRIVVDSENEVDLLVQTRHLRDVIVLVIRGLAQRYNSTSLNSLLKIET